MRIRNFRREDIPALVQIQQEAARADGDAVMSEQDFIAWLMEPEIDALANAFVITDDDDELNTWGQAGTLEGIEGEIVGYTVVQMRQEQDAYHFLCQGTVQPARRLRNAGRALLICALNRARMIAAEFEFEAEQQGLPIYFEALLPIHDPAAARLAARCKMQPVESAMPHAALQLYRCEL